MDFETLKKYDDSLSEWVCAGELGKGGFGTMSSTVYRLERSIYDEFGREIDKKTSALKIVGFGSVRPDTARLNKVFERLQDNIPHAVNIEDWSRTPIATGPDGSKSYYIYILMEKLEPLPSEGLDENEVLRLAYEIGTALHELHDRRVKGERFYHCDIKPDNIMYSSDGSRAFKLCDFDDARGVRGSKLPISDVGTPGYRSPELIVDKRIDNRSDIYSLGVTMYTLLNGGKPPFFGGDINSTIRAEVKGRRFPRIKGVSRDVMRLIWRMCRRKPSERFENAAEFLEALGPLINAHDRRAKKLGLYSGESAAETAVKTAPQTFMTGTLSPSDISSASSRRHIEMNGTVLRAKKTEALAAPLQDGTRRTLANAAAEINRSLAHPRIYVRHDIMRIIPVILLIVIIPAILIRTLLIPHYAYVDRHFIPVFASTLDLSDKDIRDVSGLERCTGLRILNLRGNPVPPEDIDALQLKLPKCKMIRDVFIGDTVLGSDAVSLSTADFVPGDEKLLTENIGRFTDIAYINMSGSVLSRGELVSLRDSTPDGCTVYWTETLDGTSYGIDAKKLELTTFDDNTADALSNFTDIEYVDLSSSSYSDKQLDGFRSSYPGYNIRWKVSFFGKELSTETTSISLRGADTGPYNENGELVKLVYFKKLESLDLYGTKFDSYAFLENCQSVRELYLRNSSFREFSMLSSMKGLRSLDIGNLRIGDTSFLADLKGLKRLRIDRCLLDSGFDKNLTRITGLRILDCSFTGIDLSVLADMPELKAVRAFDNPATRLNVTYDTPDRNRMYFYQLENVSTLEVLFANIDADGIRRAVSNCAGLKVLNVCGWKNTDVYLDNLSDHRQLRFIGVPGAYCRNEPEHLENLDVLMVYSISTKCSNFITDVSPDCKIYDLDGGSFANFNDYGGYDFMLMLCELYAPDCLEY